MTIASFPAALVPAIQTNMLEREFQTGLESALVYRSVADLEIFPSNVGETLTKTRKGLKAPVTTPMTPSANTNLDNGLSPASWTVEQYVLGISEYADTIDLNMITQRVGIEDQFLHNAYTNGRQASQSVDRIARKALFDAYMGGNTRVRVAPSGSVATLAVDDIRGFQFAPVVGVMTAISAGNTITVTIGAVSYTLQGAAADVSNVSTAPGGISGVLTFSGNVATADAPLNGPVIAQYAPSVLRPNGRATTAALLASDMFSMSIALDAVTRLENNAVPKVNGLYNCYLDNTSARQLFADPDFKQLFQGANASQEFARGKVVELLDLRFIRTTEALQQTIGAVNVHRPIVVGAGALVEGVFDATAYSNLPGFNDGLIYVQNGIAMVTRPPLDRLRQIIAQSWYYIGGFTVPSDVTATSTIIPTASSAIYKRAVMVEHG